MATTKIPEKPETKSGFEKPVAWLLGRQLISSLKHMALYAAFKGKLDPRDWMSTRVYSFVPGTGTREPSDIDIEPIPYTSHNADNEFWFDYLADCGDGQMAVYGIAYLCMSSLWIDGPPGWEKGSPPEIKKLLDEKKVSVMFVQNDAHLKKLYASANQQVLPRGTFLLVGGDTSYHISDYATLANRFQNPFWWAYCELLKRRRLTEEQRHPLFGIPGNHDYYDALDGFNRQFRRPATGEDVAKKERRPLLSIPTYMRCQEASYLALQLPYDWWFWAFDTENGDMDFRQRIFFKRINQKIKPRKLIVATSQPVTIFGRYARPDDPLVEEFNRIELECPFLKGAPKLDEGKCRLDLSGDVHHYVRYWGPNSSQLPQKELSADNYASVVSGMGGAFLHPSQTDVGEVDEQTLYPTKENSRRAVAREILNFWNLVMGGYVWLIGFIIALIVFVGATIAPTSSEFVNCIPALQTLKITHCRPTTVAQVEPGEGTAPQTSEGVSATRAEAYVPWRPLLIISIIAITGLVIYSNSMFNEIYKKQAQQRERQQQVTVTLADTATLKKAWPFWILLTIALVSLINVVWDFIFYVPPSSMTPFASSMIVLAAFVWGACAIIECFLYSEWLFHQAYDRIVMWYDYWPIGLLVSFAILTVALALWYFGQHNLAAFLISDIIFALTVVAVFFGLIFFAVTTGGQLQSRGGKLLFALFGLWHAVLQLLVPFLLIMRGSWLSLVVLSVAIVVFRWMGMRLINKHSRWLVILWLVYGFWLLYLPFLLPPSRALFSTATVPKALLTLVFAGFIGMVMTCVSFGWYLAVSLAFNGHNNEAGGAARIERFKEFIRIRITPTELTAYVIGFDDPQIEGENLEPKIIDMFQLKCS